LEKLPGDLLSGAYLCKGAKLMVSALRFVVRSSEAMIYGILINIVLNAKVLRE
jgi:hypothetical protein